MFRVSITRTRRRTILEVDFTFLLCFPGWKLVIRLNVRRSLQPRLLPTTCEQQPVSSSLISKQYDKHCDVMVLSSGMHRLNLNPNSTFQLTCMDTGCCRTVPRFHRDTHTVSGIFQGQTHSPAMLLSFLAIFSFATCTPRSP